MAGKWTSGRRGTLPMPLAVDGYKPPVKPKDLDADAERLWKVFVSVLIEKRIVGQADEAALVHMCETYSLYRQVMAIAKTQPANFKSASVMLMYWKSLQAAAKSFGANELLRSKLAGKDSKSIGIAPRRRA